MLRVGNAERHRRLGGDTPVAGVIRGGSVKQCLDGAIKGEENAKSADGLRNEEAGGRHSGP